MARPVRKWPLGWRAHANVGEKGTGELVAAARVVGDVFRHEGGRFVVARRLRHGVQGGAVGTQDDELPGEILPGFVAGDQEGTAAGIRVHGLVGIVRGRPVPPLVHLARAGAVDLDPRVAGIADDEPTVREQGDGLGMAELARAFPAFAQRLDVGAGGVEGADFLRLRVQNVDRVVVVHRDRADRAEEILVGAFELADRDLRDEDGGGLPIRPFHGFGPRWCPRATSVVCAWSGERCRRCRRPG